MNKISREEAFHLVNSAIEKNEDLGFNDLKELMYFFAPPIPKKPKNDYEWVARFVAEEDVREYFNYIYVEGKSIIASDGGIMGVIPNKEKLDNGYYSLVAGRFFKEDVEMDYPDWERVLKNFNSEKLKKINGVPLKSPEGGFYTGYSDLIFSKKYADLITNCEMFVNKDNMFFKNRFGYGVVMSVRMGKEDVIRMDSE